MIKKWKCIVGGLLVLSPVITLCTLIIIDEGWKFFFGLIGMMVSLAAVLSLGCYLINQCLEENP